MVTNTRNGLFRSWHVWLLVLCWFSASGSSKNIIPEQTSYFRVDTALTLQIDTLAFYAQTGEETPAAEAKYSAFNINDGPSFPSVNWEKARHTIKLHVTNIGSSAVSCAIRHYGKNNSTVIKVVSQSTGKESTFEIVDHSFFGAARGTFEPGRSTVYIFYNDQLRGQLPVYIDFLPEFLLEDDKVQHFIKFENIIVPLLIFNFFILYQLIYIVIQGYYHRKNEYSSYFMYLLCLLVYFGFRLVEAIKLQPLHDVMLEYLGPVNTIMLVLPYFFYLRFARRFLEMATYHPGVNKYIIIIERTVLGITLVISAVAFLIDSITAYIIAFGAVVVLFIVTLLLIRFFYLQRNKLYKFFLIGSLFATTGHAIAMSLSVFGSAYWGYFPPILATMIGISIEIFYFNTGLGYKAKYEQEEKLKAQAELIGQLDENRKIQSRLGEMRNRIASDLHDDVGSTLSSIGLYSEVAMKQIDKDPDSAKSILNRIAESSSRMMEAMSDIVWAIHSRQDEAGSLSTRMTRFASERLAHAGVKFEMRISDAAEGISFTIEARRNLLLLFKEAVNNAAKYSKATLIQVSMEVSGPLFRLVIHDNGTGFDVSAAGKGHGLYTLKERAVQLGGECQLISSPGLGTTVTAEVPLKSIALPGSSNHLY